MPMITCPNCGAKNRVDDRAQNFQPVCGRCGTKLSLDAATATPLIVTDATFQQDVLGQGGRPVLVDCWAAWCGPCRMIAPAIEELAGESAGRYVVAKLDVDQNPKTATQYQIDSIPTLLLFKNGAMVDRIVGLQPKAALAQRLLKLI